MGGTTPTLFPRKTHRSRVLSPGSVWLGSGRETSTWGFRDRVGSVCLTPVSPNPRSGPFRPVQRRHRTVTGALTTVSDRPDPLFRSRAHVVRSRTDRPREVLYWGTRPPVGSLTRFVTCSPGLRVSASRKAKVDEAGPRPRGSTTGPDISTGGPRTPESWSPTSRPLPYYSKDEPR